MLTATHRSNTVYDAGNTQFAIRIHITDQKTIFAAETGCWIELRMLVAFAEQLCALEEQRQGSVALQSIMVGTAYRSVWHRSNGRVRLPYSQCRLMSFS